MKNILKIIEDENSNIEKLRNFRNNVYSHFNKKIFNEEWQKSYKKENNFEFPKLKTVCLNIFDDLSRILEILGAEIFDKSFVLDRDVKKLIERLW